VTKRHPLTADYFREFEASYHGKPRAETERFRRFTRDEIAKRDDNLDIFWLKDESLADTANLPPPEVIADEMIEDLRAALDELEQLRAGFPPREPSAGPSQ
jgi:type I restriction enzyme M protein